MGLPIVSDSPQTQPPAAAAAAGPSNPNTTSTSTSNTQPSSSSSTTTQQHAHQNTTTPTTLPPEALELAAKIFDLARTGATPALTQYLGAGIPANLTNSTGDTLLMLASYHGHAETVRALLGRGADPNVTNARGQSPLAGATFKGFEDVVRALYEAGADKDLGRPTAVETARIFKRDALLELFGWSGEEGDGGVPAGVPRGPPAGGVNGEAGD